MTGLDRRRAIALTALIGVFISTYLYLYALGYYGELACGGAGGCSEVQASRYSRFLGFPVAGWGLGWYLAVFATSLVSVTSRGDARWVSVGLVALSTGGLIFTAYLTALELWVIHAICRWCVVSAVLTLTIFALSIPEVRIARGRVAPVSQEPAETAC
ncbi:MAG: vitamin K epoxide reductase family protein [Gemmatimonadota bacterium]